MKHPRPNLYSSSHGSCDCCGKTRSLTFVIWQGIDTYACSECRGVEDDEESHVDFIAFLETMGA